MLPCDFDNATSADTVMGLGFSNIILDNPRQSYFETIVSQGALGSRSTEFSLFLGRMATGSSTYSQMYLGELYRHYRQQGL